MSNIAPMFSLHLEGGSPGTHSVPASVLVQVIENAQSAVELIGCYVEGKEFRQRVKIPAKIRRKYQLVCHIPVSGSYAMPMTLGEVSSDLFAIDEIERAWNAFTGLLCGVSTKSTEKLKEALPDTSVRRRVLEYIKGMAPAAGSGWQLDVQRESGERIALFDEDSQPFVQSVLVPAEQREAERTITGELKSIDFTQRQFRIVYPPTQREMVCSYDEAIEDMLYENRRSLIQVTGRVVFNDEDMPKELHSVSDVRDLDLSSFAIDLVRSEGRGLKAKQLFSIEPILDDSQQYLCLKKDDLGIDVFAQSREQLSVELADQILMMWDEYANVDDNELELSALPLKRALLATFEELVDAA